jgi:transposase-like protein
MGSRKQFTPEFKREAVQLLEGGGRPASAMARELGITRNHSTSGRRNYGLVGIPRFLVLVRARSGRQKWPG